MADRSGTFSHHPGDPDEGRSGDPLEGSAGRGSGLIGWLKQRITEAAIAVAVVIAILQILVPWFFDLMFSVILIALVWIIGTARGNRQ